jgi:hypothetical protein
MMQRDPKPIGLALVWVAAAIGFREDREPPRRASPYC